MLGRLQLIGAGIACVAIGYLAAGPGVLAQQGVSSIAAIPNQKGGQDVFGAYDVVADWPKDLATIPGHEAWTFGAGSSVFAESADRIYAIEHGELPAIKRPMTKKLSDMGPSIFFPIGRLPWRDTTSASPPGNGGSGQLAEGGMQAWERAGNKMGVDARWEHNILVFDGAGNLLPDTANFMQWDSMMQRPHSITISPYDPEKAVYFVDDHKHFIYKFSNDGKRMLATWGTWGVPGADSTHFNRPTYIDFFPDGGFVVADGYNGTRVVKFDKNGKYVTAGVRRARTTTTRGRLTSTTSMASPSTRPRGASSSTTAATIVRRCSTRTANSSISGNSATPPRTSTCSTSPATGISGPPIAERAKS
jgi:hypothetical protein